MKKIVFVLMLTAITAFTAEGHKFTRWHSATINMSTFYNDLSPYGDWIYTPDYGYVWRPYFDRNECFRPYSSAGRWVNTRFGWTWASDYEWGWATFHYGRWYFDDYLGWMWIPGTEWAPAWVSWGYYDNYYGWAPMGPNVNVGISWSAPAPWWTFVDTRHFCSNDWHNYIWDRPVHVTQINYITNIYQGDRDGHNDRHDGSWYYGPRVNEVERHTGTRVREVNIVDSDKPRNSMSGGRNLNLYRPSVKNDDRSSRPESFTRLDDSRRNASSIRTEPRRNDPGSVRTRSEVSPTNTPAGSTRPSVRREINPNTTGRPENNTRTIRPDENSTQPVRPSNQGREIRPAQTNPEVRPQPADYPRRNDAAQQGNTNRGNNLPTQSERRDVRINPDNGGRPANEAGDRATRYDNRNSTGRSVVTENNNTRPQPSRPMVNERRSEQTASPSRATESRNDAPTESRSNTSSPTHMGRR